MLKNYHPNVDSDMKFRFYFADVGFIPRLDHDLNFGVKRILNSFAMKQHVLESVDKRYGRNYFSEHVDKKGVHHKERKNPDLQLFLDSGAYTAWNLAYKKKMAGDPKWEDYMVNIDEYIAFIKSIGQEEFAIIANLDMIPGKPGVPETPEELEYAAQKGWDNMLYMESKGIKVAHIFHQGEDFKWLKKISEHQEYIGVSPNNTASTAEKRLWLDRVYEFLDDGKGGCRNKTHGFGVSSIPLMMRYPWYSCDSSTWSMGRRTGTIKLFLPEIPKMFGFSIAMSDQVGVAANTFHYDFLDSEIKKIVDEYFEKYGFDAASMRVSHEARDKANLTFFLLIEKYINDHEIKFKRNWMDIF